MKEDPNSLGVDIPETVEVLLDQDADLHQKFNKLTLGKQRSIIHQVNRVKNIDRQITKTIDYFRFFIKNYLDRNDQDFLGLLKAIKQQFAWTVPIAVQQSQFPAAGLWQELINKNWVESQAGQDGAYTIASGAYDGQPDNALGIAFRSNQSDIQSHSRTNFVLSEPIRRFNWIAIDSNNPSLCAFNRDRIGNGVIDISNS